MNARRACLAALALLALGTGAAWAAEPVLAMPGLQLNLDGNGGETASAIKVLLGLTVLSLAPAILMSMTSFVRIVIVL